MTAGTSTRAVAAHALAFVVLLSGATSVLAQGGAKPTTPGAQPHPPRADRYELFAGASWLGSYDLGSRDALLTANTGSGSDHVVLFRTASEIASAPAVDVKLGVGVTRRLVADAGFSYGGPELRVRISGDFEQAADVTTADAISQYVIEGGVRYHFTGWSAARGAMSSFASGGFGYLRQLASDASAVETGTIAHAGGGLLWRLGGNPRGALRNYGLRMDARVNWRWSGIDLEDKVRMFPSLGAGLYLRF